MTIWIAIILVLVWSNQSTAQSDVDCFPSNSVVDPSMKTTNNKLCFFPFVYDNVTYTDCAGDARRWCATTCNFMRDHEFGLCRWEKKNFLAASCQNLSTSQQSADPMTQTGGTCLFPFVYQNQCYNDCISAESGNRWCATTSSVDLNSAGYDNCYYTLENLKASVCANISNSQKYNYPDTVSGTKCFFPFIYNGECKSECVLGVDGNPWCSTDRVYQTNNFAVCQFQFEVKKYGTILKHGLYAIYPECTYNPFCGASVVSSSTANFTLVLLAKDNSSYPIKLWEVIPQPDSTVIISAPMSQTPSNQKRTVWSIAPSSLLVLDYLRLYAENIRFTLNTTNKDNVFLLSKTVGSTVTWSSVLGFHSSRNNSAPFALIEDVPVKQYWRFELVKEFTLDDLKYSDTKPTAASTFSTTAATTTTGSTSTSSPSITSSTTDSTTSNSKTPVSTATATSKISFSSIPALTTSDAQYSGVIGSTSSASVSKTTTGATTTASTSSSSMSISSSTTSSLTSNSKTTVSTPTETSSIPVHTTSGFISKTGFPATLTPDVSNNNVIQTINTLQIIVCVTLSVVIVVLVISVSTIVFLIRHWQ